MKYYVYVHVNEQDEILYIGHGSYQRAWENNSSRRKNKEHSEWMTEQYNNGSTNFVKIYQNNLTRTQARTLERMLITKYNPRFNIASNLEYIRSNDPFKSKEFAYKRFKKVALNGVIYDSAKIAAKANLVNYSSLMYWCRTNKYGWSYV